MARSLRDLAFLLSFTSIFLRKNHRGECNPLELPLGVFSPSHHDKPAFAFGYGRAYRVFRFSQLNADTAGRLVRYGFSFFEASAAFPQLTLCLPSVGGFIIRSLRGSSAPSGPRRPFIRFFTSNGSRLGSP